MAPPQPQPEEIRKSGRDRILEAAYPLFSRSGIRAVGVDTVVEAASVAKMTLYRNFPSKNDLALAFMEMREERWTHAWLQAEVERRATDPASACSPSSTSSTSGSTARTSRAARSSTSCSSWPTTRTRYAGPAHLANIRDFLRSLAREAGIADPDAFARQWHILMKGSIVSAGEGDREAARRARELGVLLLERHGVLEHS